MFVLNTTPQSSARINKVHDTLLSVYKGAGGWTYEFDKKGFAVIPGDTLEVKLADKTVSGGFKAHIVSYVSTAPNLSPVVALTPTPSTWPPIHPYDPATEKITFGLFLPNHHLIFIGVIVRVTDPQDPKNYVDIICDPQVGNGPPYTQGDRTESSLLPQLT